MASYPLLMEGRQEIVQQAALVTDLAGSLAPSSNTAPATTAPAAVVTEAGLLDIAAAASAQPVALMAAGPEAVAPAGQTGSRRMLMGAQHRRLLQTCPPSNPCLVSTALQRLVGDEVFVTRCQQSCCCCHGCTAGCNCTTETTSVAMHP